MKRSELEELLESYESESKANGETQDMRVLWLKKYLAELSLANDLKKNKTQPENTYLKKFQSPNTYLNKFLDKADDFSFDSFLTFCKQNRLEANLDKWFSEERISQDNTTSGKLFKIIMGIGQANNKCNNK